MLDDQSVGRFHNGGAWYPKLDKAHADGASALAVAPAARYVKNGWYSRTFTKRLSWCDSSVKAARADD